MNMHFRHLGIVAIFSAFTWLVSTACSSSNNGTAVEGPGVNGASLCEGACPKTCVQDADCNQGGGQLCCDYGGSYGKACQAASACPVFCTSDSQCDTAGGEACCQGAFGSTQKICAQSASCVTPCTSDTQCNTSEGGVGIQEQCELAYESPVCVPSEEWLPTCTDSSGCNTAGGETCCKTISLAAPKLIASGTGVCLGPSGVAGVGVTCPTACSSDSDCSTAEAGKICCDGACASTCAVTCKTDSDCTSTGTQQICCGTGAIASPFWSATSTAVNGTARRTLRK